MNDLPNVLYASDPAGTLLAEGAEAAITSGVGFPGRGQRPRPRSIYPVVEQLSAADLDNFKNILAAAAGCPRRPP